MLAMAKQCYVGGEADIARPDLGAVSLRSSDRWKGCRVSFLSAYPNLLDRDMCQTRASVRDRSAGRIFTPDLFQKEARVTGRQARIPTNGLARAPHLRGRSEERRGG